MALDVRFGSKADMGACVRDVRFTPESGHGPGRQKCPLSAKSGHSDQPQGEAGEDRRQDRHACPLRHVPTGRGGSDPRPISENPTADR